MSKKLILNGVEIYLLPQKAAFLPAYRMLIVSDWHVGKLGHFRKEGLFVPQMHLQEDFSRLDLLINELSVLQVVFLGDLFHSDWNYEWDELHNFLRKFPQVNFKLTLGNHDMLPESFRTQSIISVQNSILLDEGLILSHQPLQERSDFLYNIVGHIHPGYEIMMLGRQYYRVPCFLLENKVLTLPAFGRWTGLHLMSKNRYNRIFSIAGNEVLEVL
ncbi:ligase-associated DNA damage response endonuclease PdeM [Sphingobacterium sp. LRF_L2]|uniref:ligase-associated DNA damage response endonuclease PdeM n=1 Tax=Sphingobacterium sp. LRF_L2 TaxID=3369421 RepID=UPI003F64130B